MKKNIDFKKEYLTIDTYSLVTMGMLVAIYIVLDRFLSFSTDTMRIGFTFVALAMAGALLGPVKAGIVAFVADILGLVLFTGYTFNPGITFNAVCVGVLFGIFLYKKPTIKGCVIAVLIHQLFFSLVLQTLWLSMMYMAPYKAMFVSRIPQTALMLVIENATLIAICNKKLVNVLRMNRV